MHGARPGRRRGFWARFSEQETGPQRVITGIAGTVTAVATTVGGVYGVAHLVGNDSSNAAASVPSGGSSSTSPSSRSSEPSTSSPGVPAQTVTVAPSAVVTTRPGQTLVLQGSAEADAFVHAFVDNPGARVDLDAVIVPESRFPRPQWIMRLWYNCHDLPAGQPPGEDLCDSVMLIFDDADPTAALFDHPRRIEMKGIWADNRPSGLGYGAKGLEIYPVPASY